MLYGSQQRNNNLHEIAKAVLIRVDPLIYYTEHDLVQRKAIAYLAHPVTVKKTISVHFYVLCTF